MTLTQTLLCYLMNDYSWFPTPLGLALHAFQVDLVLWAYGFGALLYLWE